VAIPKCQAALWVQKIKIVVSKYLFLFKILIRVYIGLKIEILEYFTVVKGHHLSF
jgi:hypothetical protein